MDCTEATINKHYYCPNLRNKIQTHIKFCDFYLKIIIIIIKSMVIYPHIKWRPYLGKDYW